MAILTRRQSIARAKRMARRYRRCIEFIKMLPDDIRPYAKHIELTWCTGDNGRNVDAYQIDFGYPVYNIFYDSRSTTIFTDKEELDGMLCEIENDPEVKGDAGGDNKWGLVESEGEDFSRRTFDLIGELEKKVAFEEEWARD